MGSIFDDMEITNKTSVLKELDDELMTKASSNDGTSIVSIDDLVEFDNHPFVVDTESNEFEELVDSIKENGLIYPILVRPMEDKYEIISGHRRVAACRAAGIEELPAIVRELDDFEATVFMVHSNFARNEISIMERAKAYRMCHDVEKHQGKKNDSGDPMQNITFDVKVNGTVTAKALKTGADGIATYKVGKYAEAPKVEVQENWTNERFEPKSTGFYGVTVYEKEADAKTHAKDAKHTWTNEQNEYYASIKKDGNKGITSKGFAGAYYGLYDTNVKANMTDDHLIAVFEMDKDGYACNLYGPTTSTVAGHTCKARLNYTEDAGWKVSRTVNGHTQYFISMGKDSLTDKKMLTDTKFAYKELVAPDGYLPTEDPIPATITKLLSVPTTLTSTQIVNMIDEDWENNPTYIYLEKRSANTKCTDGNPNYSLKGATYKVFKTNAEASAAASSRDFSKAVATLTVDEKGNSQVLNVTDYMTKNSTTGKIETTKFYIVESVTGKGYEMDKTVHPLSVTALNSKDQPATLNVEDIPVDDPIRIRVEKELENGEHVGVAGAVFTVRYYAVSVEQTETFSSLQNKKADRTETFTTDKSGTFEIKSELFPLGYLTVEETTAPTGYSMDGAKATAKGVSISTKMCFRILPEGNINDGYHTGKAYLVDMNGAFVLGNDGNRITGEDIDSLCVRMSAVNIAVHGGFGEVVCHDSLCEPGDIKFGYIINEGLYPFPGGLPTIRRSENARDFFCCSMWNARKAQMEEMTKIEIEEPNLFGGFD